MYFKKSIQNLVSNPWSMTPEQYREELKNLPYPEQQKQLEQKFTADIQDTEWMKQIRGNYDPETVKQFIEQYAHLKADLCLKEEFYFNAAEQKRLKYYDDARKHLWLILQKKLFNTYLEWAAEKIKIPEILVAADFDFWRENIWSCRFLEPLTEREVEVMKQFMQSNNYNPEDAEYFMGYMWKSFDELRCMEDEQYIYQPEFFEFYDGMMGTGYLLQLPDERGPREDFYMQILRDENARKREGQPAVEIPFRLKKLYFTELDNYVKWWFNNIETKEWQKIAAAKKEEEYRPEHQLDDQVEQAIWDLQDTPDPFFISGGKDWREAIVHTALRWRAQKAMEVIDQVYEEYLLTVETGIYPEPEFNQYDTVKTPGNEMMRKNILEARKLNGDPEDFNF